MRRFVILFLCLALLIGAVYADNRANTVRNDTTVLPDGSARVMLTVSIRLDNPVENLTFPLPKGADDVTLNGAPVETTPSRANTSVDLVDLSYLDGVTGVQDLLFGYTLPELVASEEAEDDKDERHLLLTVPLLVEKIIKGKVMPTLNKQPIKTLVKIPLLNQIVYKKVRTQLMDAFGGALTELIMGGAALNSDVEKLLKKINLPYTVGYGMTETAPLICYAHHTEYKSLSCGKLVPGMEMKIDSADPYNIPGEICVRGENVTVGYYKNQEATDAALDTDGWFHTGDMGVVDKATNCFIRGRCKTMLLSNNGQNIYPEEIEAKLNNLEAVVESLVVQEDGGKLTALVVPDYAKAKENGWDNAKLQEVMNENLVALNKLVAPYERVANIKMCEGEFEKTPKKSIKRFLYPAAAKIVS